MTSLRDQLNPAQFEAVTHGEGPLLVLAGAGSGKTRVLTYRIAHLLRAGMALDYQITAVTFTNKAAREMRERVERLTGGTTAKRAFVGTFHRWALEVLRRFPREAGLAPGFSILDSDDQRNLVNRALRELGHDVRTFPPRAVLGRISHAANSGGDAAELEERATSDLDRVAASVWERYEALKQEARAVDFDDMLLRALTALREHEKVLHSVQGRARFLLVDEFQDTNQPQVKLLKLVAGTAMNITAVGDEDQSIYRWRGAEMDNILSFESHFRGARVVTLEENYRSTQPILHAAGQLIAANQLRRGKTLFTSRQGGEPVRLFMGEDERAEARWVVERIEELRPDHLEDGIAVLVRTNAQTRPFEEELTRRQIPYRVVGGLRFWQRAEVKHAIAYLRLVVRPDDVLAFERVVNVPARGIGAATMDILERHAAASGQTLPAAARDLPDTLTPRARTALESFFEVLDGAVAERQELRPGELVGWLLEKSGLLSMYEGDDIDKVSRRENLEQLAAAVSEAADQGQDLPAFLDSVALLEDSDEETAGEIINLMTLHAGKGLEFDVVFLAGMEEGLLPHSSVREEPAAVEEERRLAYVGMTRARRWLALTATRRRFLYGTRQPSRPSRFLTDLPQDCYRNVSYVPFVLGGSRQHAGPGRGGPVATVPAVPRRKPARPIQPTVVDEDGNAWRPGDRVRHRSFGTGVVLSCRGKGPQLKLVVYFDRAGRKTLVPTLAKLEKTS